MLDRKFILENADAVKLNCKNRNVTADVDRFVGNGCGGGDFNVGGAGIPWGCGEELAILEGLETELTSRDAITLLRT